MVQDIMMQETSVIRTTKSDRVLSFLKAFLLSLAVVFTIAFTFLHEYMSMWSSEYLDYKKQHKKIISDRKDTYLKLLSNLESGKLNSSEYACAFINETDLYQLRLDDYHSTKKDIQEKYSILGYWSKKVFFLTIGFPILGLLTSVLMLYIILKRLDDSKEKLFFSIITVAIMATWVYWIIWSTLSYTENPERPYDFPRSWYNIALYTLPFVFVTIMYFAFDSHKTVKEKRASVIYMLNSLLYVDLPKKELIHPSKTKEFRKLRLDLTRKAQRNAR